MKTHGEQSSIWEGVGGQGRNRHHRQRSIQLQRSEGHGIHTSPCPCVPPGFESPPARAVRPRKSGRPGCLLLVATAHIRTRCRRRHASRNRPFKLRIVTAPNGGVSASIGPIRGGLLGVGTDNHGFGGADPRGRYAQGASCVGVRPEVVRCLLRRNASRKEISAGRQRTPQYKLSLIRLR